MRFGGRAALLLVALSMLAAGGASLFSALASHVAVDDLDDTSGRLDVRSVEVVGENKPRWKVITWPRWRAAEIWDRGYALIMLDTIAGERNDYFVLVGSNGRRLYAELFKDRRTKPDLKIADLKRVGRVDRRSFYVRLPLWRVKIGPNRLFYRWHVQTQFTSHRCRQVCFDLAPDAGPVVEPLPVPTPTPTPTPTITGSPSPSPSSS